MYLDLNVSSKHLFQLNKVPEDTRSMIASATSRTMLDDKVHICGLVQTIFIFLLNSIYWMKYRVKLIFLEDEDKDTVLATF